MKGGQAASMKYDQYGKLSALARTYSGVNAQSLFWFVTEANTLKKHTKVQKGGQAVSMEYDLQGNRTLLKDPDGGKVTSTYNAFGELVKEVQSVHKIEMTTEIPDIGTFPGGGTIIAKPSSGPVVAPGGPAVLIYMMIWGGLPPVMTISPTNTNIFPTTHIAD